MLREWPLQAHVPFRRDVGIEEVRRFCSARPRRAHDNAAEPLGATLRSISWAARGTHRAFLPCGVINSNSVEMAKVFVIESSQGLRQILITPKGTFEPEGAK
jgi:hypothetical protein